MSDTGWQRENSGHFWQFAGRYSLVALVMALLFALNVVPVHLPGFGLVRPPFVLMMVYFWAIFRPGLMTPMLAFTLGLLLDVFAGTPFGLNALVFVALQWITCRQRRFLSGQSFFLTWWGYVFAAGFAAGASWLVASLLSLHFLPPAPILMSTALGIFLFPLAVLPLFSVHKALLSLPTL